MRLRLHIYGKHGIPFSAVILRRLVIMIVIYSQMLAEGFLRDIFGITQRQSGYGIYKGFIRIMQIIKRRKKRCGLCIRNEAITWAVVDIDDAGYLKRNRSGRKRKV